MRDPEFRRRLQKALFNSVFTAAFVGGIAYFANCYDPSPATAPAVVWRVALVDAANIAAMAFWVMFPILFATKVFKSAAVLDMERRVRLAEDLFERSRLDQSGSTPGTTDSRG